MAVAAYEGMRILHNALQATKGQTGEALLSAMKAQSFESPRGPVRIDAQTRDVYRPALMIEDTTPELQMA